MQEFDAAVGDTTIVANRSTFVDFTLPYSESGVSMLVLVKDDERKNFWIFLKPLSWDLWLTTGAAFIFTGLVVWVLEHRINTEFRGPPQHQIGTIFWFSFSTLVFAHSNALGALMPLEHTLRVFFFFFPFNSFVLFTENHFCYGSRGESGEQLVKICAHHMGFCGANLDTKLHRKLDFNVDSTTAAAFIY